MDATYLVIEIQKAADGSVAIAPIIQRTDLLEAESEFYRLCSVAAVSSIPQHTILFIEDNGYYHDCKSFDHPAVS